MVYEEMRSITSLLYHVIRTNNTIVKLNLSLQVLNVANNVQCPCLLTQEAQETFQGLHLKLGGMTLSSQPPPATIIQLPHTALTQSDLDLPV